MARLKGTERRGICSISRLRAAAAITSRLCFRGLGPRLDLSDFSQSLLEKGYEKEYGLYYAETSPSVQFLQMVPFAPAYIPHGPNFHPS